MKKIVVLVVCLMIALSVLPACASMTDTFRIDNEDYYIVVTCFNQADTINVMAEDGTLLVSVTAYHDEHAIVNYSVFELESDEWYYWIDEICAAYDSATHYWYILEKYGEN